MDIPIPLDATPPLQSPAFTPDQWRTFFSITELIVPAIPSPDSSNPVVSTFAACAANADHVAFRRGVERLFEVRIPGRVKAFATVLNMLNSTAGCLLLTGSATPFHAQSAEAREALLKRWISTDSYLLFPPIRNFAIGITQITKMMWFRKATDEIYPALEFVGADSHSVAAWATNDDWKSHAPEPPKGEESGFYNEWDFVQIDGPTELEVDVVIVGSGCGGAVAAKTIAEAGLSVIVVEKGIWIPTDQLPLHEDAACETIFECGLALRTDDGGLGLLAGTTFGGGGAVNWSASLQTPHYVRKAWAEEMNLPYFQTPDFQRQLDAVCARMGVTTPTHHNHRNAGLLSGARKLGYAAAAVPQNAPVEHQDAFCSYGCGCAPHARKMGTVHTWLPDASRAGARFITEFRCESLLFSHEHPNRVVGVSGVHCKRETPVVIRARETVVSAGTLNTPTLLLNSGLTSPHIGANLHLHPGVMVFAQYPERRDPAVGACLTSIVSSFDNLDGRGHGVRLETTSMGPALTLSSLAWTGGEEWKRDVLAYQHTDGYLAIVREEHTGRVYADEQGRSRVQYTAGAKEREWLLLGIEAIAKIALTEGAVKIFAPINGFPPFTRQGDCELGIMDPHFQAWLAKLRQTRLASPNAIIASAHQMSSCRIGATARDGVVDIAGRVWGHSGVVIADASILPTASGANPMVTTMAVARHVAEGVVERLTAGRKPTGG